AADGKRSVHAVEISVLPGTELPRLRREGKGAASLFETGRAWVLGRRGFHEPVLRGETPGGFGAAIRRGRGNLSEGCRYRPKPRGGAARRQSLLPLGGAKQGGLRDCQEGAPVRRSTRRPVCGALDL